MNKTKVLVVDDDVNICELIRLYRPNKSAIDAIGQVRKRCWKYDYVIELDIKINECV